MEDLNKEILKLKALINNKQNTSIFSNKSNETSALTRDDIKLYVNEMNRKFTFTAANIRAPIAIDPKTKKIENLEYIDDLKISDVKTFKEQLDAEVEARIAGDEALDESKADKEHEHEISDVNNLQTTLTNHENLISTKADDSMLTALAARVAIVELGKADTNHSHVAANITDLQNLLDGKAAVNHNHDSSYAAINHNHDSAYSVINHTHSGYTLNSDLYTPTETLTYEDTIISNNDITQTVSGTTATITFDATYYSNHPHLVIALVLYIDEDDSEAYVMSVDNSEISVVEQNLNIYSLSINHDSNNNPNIFNFTIHASIDITDGVIRILILDNANPEERQNLALFEYSFECDSSNSILNITSTYGRLMKDALDAKATLNHTHTTFNNDLTINGIETVNKSLIIDSSLFSPGYTIPLKIYCKNITNGNHLALLFGRSENVSDRGTIGFTPHATSPYTFIGLRNNDETLKIYNDKITSTSKIIAPNFELTNQQNFEYIFTCPRFATWSTTGNNRYKRCIIGYFNDASPDFIIQTGFIKVAVVSTGSSPYGGVREYILYKAVCSTSSTTNIRETSSTIFENENSGRFAIKMYTAANNVKKLELVCDAFNTLDSIGAQITCSLPSRLRLYNEQALTNPIGKEKTLTWYYASTQD